MVTMVLYSAGRTTSYPEDAPKKGLRYHCLGGGDEVGNVGIVFENERQNRLLLDYGLAPTHPHAILQKHHKSRMLSSPIHT